MVQRRTFSPFSKRSTSAPRVSIMFSPCFSMKFSSSSGVFTCWISCRGERTVIPNTDAVLSSSVSAGMIVLWRESGSGVERTYIQDLVNVLFFQIRPCHHSTVKVDLGFEAHFTQAQVSGLHIMDGSGYSSNIQSRLWESQLWRCVCVCCSSADLTAGSFSRNSVSFCTRSACMERPNRASVLV